jgi:hypothetical protein
MSMHLDARTNNSFGYFFESLRFSLLFHAELSLAAITELLERLERPVDLGI